MGRIVTIMPRGLFKRVKIDKDVKALDIVRVPWVCKAIAANAINVRTGLKIEVICAGAVLDHIPLIQSGARTYIALLSNSRAFYTVLIP